jgi:hypothetical protein
MKTYVIHHPGDPETRQSFGMLFSSLEKIWLFGFIGVFPEIAHG